MRNWDGAAHLCMLKDGWAFVGQRCTRSAGRSSRSVLCLACDFDDLEASLLVRILVGP